MDVESRNAGILVCHLSQDASVTCPFLKRVALLTSVIPSRRSAARDPTAAIRGFSSDADINSSCEVPLRPAADRDDKAWLERLALFAGPVFEAGEFLAKSERNVASRAIAL